MHPTALVLLALTPALQEPQAAFSAAEQEGAGLMDRSRAALGAPARLAAVENRRLRGKAGWVGIDLGDGSFEETFAGAGRALLVSRFEGFGEFSLGAIDALVWERAPGLIKVKRGWEASADLRQYGILQHVDWRALYAAAKLTGDGEQGGRACRRLELTPRALVPVPADSVPAPDIWWLDAETLLPAQIDVYMNDDAGKALPRAAITLLDWKAVDGIQYPHRREIEVQGFKLALDYEHIEHDLDLPDDLFEPGAEVRAAAAAQPGPEEPVPAPDIVVETLEEVHTATIRVHSKKEDLQKTFSVIFPEVFRYVLASGGKPGVVFARFHSTDEPFDVEGGVMVEAPIEPKGRVQATKLPAGEAVVAWHIGPYHELPRTHAKVAAWMEEHGYEASGAPWEEYWTDPGLEPDPAKLRTRAVWPVRKKER